MIALLTTVHILIALVLILVVLLQSARGTDLAGAFGGMGSQTAFGPRGTTTFLSKTTAVLAAAFMVTSLSLSILSNRSRGAGGSVLSGEKQSAKPKPAPQSAPGVPGVSVTPGSPAAGQPSIHVTQEPITTPPSPAGQTPPTNPPPAAPPPSGQ